MASTSTSNQCRVPMEEAVQQCNPYPSRSAKFEDVINSPECFMDTLKKFHLAMGTKFMIPIIGGKNVNLHHLFVEVTSRGGIERVLQEKKWKEVTTTFNFPPSATNASFILRKYYMSLLHHYEQVYYFDQTWWTPNSAATQMAPLKQQKFPSGEIQVTPAKRQRVDTAESVSAATAEPSIGSPVIGVIDGKIEFGYLCTITIGSEELRGVLYQSIHDSEYQTLPSQCQNMSANNTSTSAIPASGVTRRRRRKKSEMKKRDPAHPKPNRSGYNFFFAEQHARLKPLHPGKDRDISRMIGESWNQLTDTQREVYKEKALRDKERYVMELALYKEGLRAGQVITNTVPLQQQQPLEPDVNMDDNIEPEGGASPQTPGNELSSGNSAKSSCETETMDSDMGLMVAVDMLPKREAVLSTNGLDKVGNGVEECLNDVQMEARGGLLSPEEKQLVNIKDTVLTFTEERVQQKTLPIEEEEQVAPIQENEQLCSERMIEKESAPPQKKESESHGEIPHVESKMPQEERDWMGIEDRTETETESMDIQEKESVVNEVREEKEFMPIHGEQLVCNEKNENNHMADEEKHSAEVRENVENEAVHAEEKESIVRGESFTIQPVFIQKMVIERVENEPEHDQEKASLASDEKVVKEAAVTGELTASN